MLSVVDRIMNNYGEVKININQGQKDLQVKGGSPLLSTLAEQKIYLPSACGGKGTCGTCKCKVTSDIGPHLPTESPLLTTAEMKENIRLACQVKVKSNLSIEIPEALFNIKEFKTTVDSIVDVTHDIKEVYLKLDNPFSISFKAGQYAQLVIPPYDKIKNENQRAYSFLSTPQETGRVGFLIRLVPGGIATSYVHQYLNKGDSFRIIAPVGDFFLRETDAIMLCVAGGSGMAPLHSILFDMVNKGNTNREVWYFFGAVTKSDLFYVEKFRELEKKWPGFHFVPALSEPKPEDKWTGETGLITEVLDRYILKLGADREKEGYLCGSPGMINACVNVMKKHKVKEEKIYYDKFA
ncbi:MAG: 2Fe-2S iron-sulfur cluster binding domain-containing protein [Spirochaetales bacterium]|nr:2Fe-2S iron-sulfur cluster binding domain-containing protein [Spirochaetales bacterium]